MSTEMQTKMKASPEQNFTPVLTGLLQRKSTLCNTPGLVEDSKRDKENLTLEHSSVEPRFGHDFSKVQIHNASPTAIQTKLTIGQPNDRYEQEADRVAEQVMSMPEPQILRQVEPEEEDEEEEPIQAKQTSGQTLQPSPVLQTQICALRGGGKPLPKFVRNFFEPRFGYDFSQVRVHSDAQAVESARALNARAYTVKQDVVFGAGQYAPNATAGAKLLAHELTHVIQQSSNNHNILPKTKMAEKHVSDYISKGGYVQVGLKTPVGISLAAMEENSTVCSQESESKRKLGFCSRFIDDIDSLAMGSDTKQWRSQDLNQIGRLALEYMDASQLRVIAGKLGIPAAQEAILETPTEEVIQRDAAAAATVAGTMWWLTLVDGPIIPVGDLIYLGLIAVAAVAVATTASSLAQPLPAPQEVPVPEEVPVPRTPGEVIPIESHPRYQPHFQEPVPEPPVSRPLGPDIFPVPRSEPRRPSPRRRNECLEQNPTFIACDGFRNIYEAAANFLQIQNEIDVDFDALGECRGRTTFNPNVIEACDHGPGENWHCQVEGAFTPLSIFGCLCCEEDGTAGHVWRRAHWSSGRE